MQNLGTPVSGWVLAPQGSILNRAAQDNPQILAACLHIARSELGIIRCFCVRIGYDPQTLSVILGAVQTVVVWWPTDSPREYHTLQHEIQLPIDIKHLFSGMDQPDVCWV